HAAKTSERIHVCSHAARPEPYSAPGFTQGWRTAVAFNRAPRELRNGRHWHRTEVRPRSVSDTAHDNGAASDTYEHSPVPRPRPCAVPASTRPAPRGCDDR